MVYIFIVLVLYVIAMGIYRMIKKRTIPSNHYTPYDEITMGRKNETIEASISTDSKHQVGYEEKKK